jgi:hypothetical protein
VCLTKNNKGVKTVNQYNYDYPNHYKIEGVEERILDSICEMLSTSVKDLITKTEFVGVYKNFTAKLSNGKEIDCEISINSSTNHWEATVWEME